MTDEELQKLLDGGIVADGEDIYFLNLVGYIIARELLEARALLADCNECLREGETPRQRMDRDHKDVLALMEMLAKDRKRRDEAEAANGRYLYLLQGILKTAKQGHSIATQVWIEAIESTLKGTTE